MLRRATPLLFAALAPSALADAPAREIPESMPECATLPPDHTLRNFTGYGIAGSEVEALQTAREDARAQIQAAACSSEMSKRRCDGLMSRYALQYDEQVQYVRKGFPRRERYRACFTLQAPAHVVDWRYQQQQFREAARGMVMDVVARFGREDLRIDAPVWAESQCSVGGAGEAIIGELAGAFGSAAVRVDESALDISFLRVQLAESDERLDLIPTFVDTDGSATRLAPIAFRAELFQLDREQEPSCRWDRELGLIEGHRDGADGRSVRVVISGNTGQYCEGDRMEPVVLVDRPSRVRVFSVERDGRALVIWPYAPNQDDLVERSLSLGQAQVQRPKLGEERLVAVAIPAEESFGDTDGWRGCYWPTAFGPSSMPAHAAVGTVGFLVAPEGTEGCPADVSLVAIPELPVCGQ